MPNPHGTPENLTGPRFQKGQSGNPGGKTREQRKAEVEAAELAAKAQRAMLEALAEHVAEDPEAALAAIKADPLKLIKDAMDRAHGQPEQTVNATVTDGTSKLHGYLNSISDRQSGGEDSEPPA